jgi:hypothetical protein
MTTTVKAADAAQFLALVPRMLGYTPRRSVVVVPMGGARSLGGMRLDLPPDDAGTHDGFAATLVGMVCRISRSDALVAIVYTDQAVGSGLPHAPLASAIARAADASGLALIDLLVVGPDGWGSHVGPDTAPHPLTELDTLDHALPRVEGDQLTGAVLPECKASDRRSTEAAHRSLESALAVLCGLPRDDRVEDRVDPAALEAACELDDLPLVFERALSWDAGGLPAMRTALLGCVLGRPSLRDIALVQWASDAAGGEEALKAQLRWEDGEEYPADLASVMWGEGGRRPDPQRLDAALTLVRHVAARTGRPRRAGALAVCAWLSWALGRSTHADRYARDALEIDPDHGLADIVRSFVASAHLPEWAYERLEAEA